LPAIIDSISGRVWPRDGADQREGDIARLIDRIGAGQAGLFEDADPQPVAAVDAVGLDRRFMKRLGRRLIAAATGYGEAQRKGH
jgi:hypothetical protein